MRYGYPIFTTSYLLQMSCKRPEVVTRTCAVNNLQTHSSFTSDNLIAFAIHTFHGRFAVLCSHCMV